MKLPNKKPEPDFNNILDVLRKEDTEDKVVLYEFFADLEIKKEIADRMGLLTTQEKALKKEDLKDRDKCNIELDLEIKYRYHLGYDYIHLWPLKFDFPKNDWKQADTREGSRSYVSGSDNVISSYSDFEAYPWPELSGADYSHFEKAKEVLPESMKVVAGCDGGILENTIWLLGYEGISYMLFDNPELVVDTFSEVATRIIGYFDNVASMEIVGAIIMGDDMGFKTSTILSPEVYRKYLFPWHKKLIDAVHKHGKPIILHSCGNLRQIMDDIIACGWDGKHSFEDGIEPVWEAKKKYGDRIALLGGFDMDKLCRLTQKEVKSHTRFLIEKCQPGGGWALGSGNSIANYVNVDNYLAMLEKG
jgi:uroporphyrinogen decarboxylase